MTTYIAFGSIGSWEWIILLALGLLIFGKRLPEVGKSLGKGIVEFKKGLAGIEDDVEKAVKQPPAPKIESDQRASIEPESKEEKVSSQTPPSET